MNEVITKVSSRLGISPSLLRVALPVALAVGAWGLDRLRTKAAWNKGFAAYEQQLRDGTAELDGNMVEVIDKDTKQATEDAIYLRGQVAGFNDAQTQFIATLEGINANHATAIGVIGTRPYTPVERSWRDTDVPTPTGLRLNRIVATRGANPDRSELPDLDDRRPVAGYLAGDSRGGYP